MVIRGLRWFFGVAALLALIAGVLLFVLASETDRFFSWTIEPPATAAFLGAAYWAACVLLAWAAAQRSWPRVRPAIPPVFVIAVLLLVATLIRLDKFDLDSIFGWFWLVVYVTVPPLLALLVLRQHRAAGPVHPGAGGIALGARALLIAQATVMLALGGALFVAPTSADALWPWTLTPLTAEAIGAFLVGFGIAAAVALREDDLDRLEGPALAYAALGVLELAALAIHSDDPHGERGGNGAVCRAVGERGRRRRLRPNRPQGGVAIVVGIDAHLSPSRSVHTCAYRASTSAPLPRPRAVRWIISATRSPSTTTSSTSW